MTEPSDTAPAGPSPSAPAPKQGLRVASWVFTGVTLVGVAILAYEIVWVEKLSGREIFNQTFYRARVARRKVKPDERRSPYRREKHVVEQLMNAAQVGPVRLKQSQNPCRVCIDLTAALFDPDQETDSPSLKCRLAMADQFGNELWSTAEVIREDMLSDRETASYAAGVYVFDAPYDGEFYFKPKLERAGVFVKRARLRVRANVQRSSLPLTAAGAVMFFVGLLAAVSCSKAYELSKPPGERSAWVDEPFALGDPSLRPPPAEAASPPASDADKQETAK